jgi:hypothetical protein
MQGGERFSDSVLKYESSHSGDSQPVVAPGWASWIPDRGTIGGEEFVKAMALSSVKNFLIPRPPRRWLQSGNQPAFLKIKVASVFEPARLFCFAVDITSHLMV